MFTIEDAIRLATSAHEGQVDKNGVDYIEHPVSVSALIVMLPSFHMLSEGDKKTAVLAAVLHDVLEDTEETVDSLASKGVPAAAIKVIKILTKTRGEDLGSYYSNVVKNPIARCVKTADLLHNNLPSRKEGLKAETALRLSLKYGLAIPRIVVNADKDFFYSMVEK